MSIGTKICIYSKRPNEQSFFTSELIPSLIINL